MATSAKAKTTTVPRGTTNPIEYLMAHGWTEPKLAVAWGLKTDNSVRRLRKFGHVPKYATAAKMAETFGWASAGEVMDFWGSRVRARRAA